MGRKATNSGAIPRFRPRRQKSGKVHYYYDHGIGKDGKRHETPLGADYGIAIKRWAEIERERNPPAAAVLLFKHVVDGYRVEVIPTKSARTQKDNGHELTSLLKFFDDPPAPLDSIRPLHIRQYIKWRGKAAREAAEKRNAARRKAGRKELPVPATLGGVRANREIALFSHIWNWARGEGYTDLPNPCEGIKRNKEEGRDVYVEDATYRAVYAVADQTLKDALDLAYLTGQRPSDVWSMDQRQLTPRGLMIRQGKTGAKIAMEVTGELAAVIERIKARKRDLKLRSTRLIVDEDGLAVGRHALRYRFDQARERAGVPKDDFQFRDLRAKAGTDKTDSAGDIRQAQAQLGHASVVTTEIYVRKRRGAKTSPTK